MTSAKLPPWVMDSFGRLIYTPSGDDPWEPLLTPGAYLAKQRGCTCSRLDNHWGEGNSIFAGYDDDGADVWEIEYVITPSCPLHDPSHDNQDQRSGEADSGPRGVDGDLPPRD